MKRPVIVRLGKTIHRSAEVHCVDAESVRLIEPTARVFMRSGTRYAIVRDKRESEPSSLVDYVLMSDDQISQPDAWRDALRKLQ